MRARRLSSDVPPHARAHAGAHLAFSCEQPDAASAVCSPATCCSSAASAVRICSATIRRDSSPISSTIRSMRGSCRSTIAIEVHPGHGAGSLCGAGIGKEPSSTIGQERRVNPMLQYASKDEFVTAVLADLPETPPYFARMKHLNQRGPRAARPQRSCRGAGLISPLEAFAVSTNGGVVVDLRAAEHFGKGHPTGALNIAYGSKVGYWAGWVIPPMRRSCLD